MSTRPEVDRCVCGHNKRKHTRQGCPYCGYAVCDRTHGLRGIVGSNATTQGKLTEADLVKAWVAMLDRKPQPHRHVIASDAKPGTCVRCADCGIPVIVPMSRRETA